MWRAGKASWRAEFGGWWETARHEAEQGQSLGPQEEGG